MTIEPKKTPGGHPEVDPSDVDIDAGAPEPPSIEDSLRDLPPPPIRTNSAG